VKRYFEGNLELYPGTFDYFYRWTYMSGLVALPKEDAPVILSDNTENVKKVIDDISIVSTDKLIKKITKKKKEKRIGFGIVTNETHIQYTIISAKPNKAQTQLISKFEYFNADEDNKTLVTSEQEKIIKLIKKHNITADIDESFALSKQIFNAIAKKNLFSR